MSPGGPKKMQRWEALAALSEASDLVAKETWLIRVLSDFGGSGVLNNEP